MKTTVWRLSIGVLLGLCFSVVPALGQNVVPISVFNTGVSNTGALLSAGSADPHYQLVANPDGGGTTSFVTSTIPSPPWVSNGPKSQWIAPDPNQDHGNFPGGTYNYKMTFDLTGLDPNTAQLTGQWATDNSGEIFLNGVSTGFTTPDIGFESFSPFTITSGFVAGLNTLEFKVFNDAGSSTGLRVEIGGTAQGPYNVCLLYDPTKAVKSGATIPLKLYLCDSTGSDLSSSSVIVHATSLVQVSTNTTDTIVTAGDANPDNDFRFDATLGPSGGYIFNLKTTGLAAGTYNLSFTAGSDLTFTYTLQFQVK